jgi:hypothetical protein
MSLDLYLSRPICPTCGQEPEELYFNCTYNLAPMWYKIYPEDSQFVDIDEMSGAEAEPRIRSALIMLEEHKEEFEKLNSPNGWGTYADFLDFLHRVHQACIDYPELVWESDR